MPGVRVSLNSEEFSSQIKTAARHINDKIAIDVQRRARDIFKDVVRFTPVRTGRARYGWRMTKNKPSIWTPVQRIFPYPSKAEATVIYPKPVETMSTARTIDRIGTQIYITNNVEYIEHLEYGTARNRPAMMVHRAIANAEAKSGL